MATLFASMLLADGGGSFCFVFFVLLAVGAAVAKLKGSLGGGGHVEAPPRPSTSGSLLGGATRGIASGLTGFLLRQWFGHHYRHHD